MKKFIPFFLLLITLTSCEDFLVENPRSIMVDANFYKTEEDADAAVVAVYDGLNDQSNIFYRGMYLLAELPTDNAECGQGVANANIFALKNYTHGPVNDRIYVMYTAIYKTIANANVAIDKITPMSIDEKKKGRLIAESKFIRALLYFNLVRLYGDVPLVVNQVTSLENINIPRTDATKVYEQIISDLQYAEHHLEVTNTSANQGRATKASASGLLAKVYLTLKDYPKARDKAKEVIDMPSYGLVDNYFDIFTPENRFNKELIFAVQGKGNTGTSNGFAMALFLPRSSIPLPTGGMVAGNSADVPTEEFYNSFQAGDLRKERTFFTSYDAGGGKVTFRPHWYKFFDPSSMAALGQGTLVFPIVRYSDMLLTYAEASNEISGPTSESKEAFNKVRRRAYGKAINASQEGIDLQISDKQAFQDAILQERRWEFGFENHRWFDLVRTGKLISTLQAKGTTAIKEHHVLFPLPQREIDVNPSLRQNVGYTN